MPMEYGLLWIPTLVMVAQTVFLLKHEQSVRQRDATDTVSVGVSNNGIVSRGKCATRTACFLLRKTLSYLKQQLFFSENSQYY